MGLNRQFMPNLYTFHFFLASGTKTDYCMDWDCAFELVRRTLMYRWSRGNGLTSSAELRHERSLCLHLAARRSAFTLIDILISISIVGILLGLLLPSLTNVNETARRIACRSNIRQIGVALSMYASASRGELPSSVFRTIRGVPGTNDSPQNMLTLRIQPEDKPNEDWNPWDGLGLLASAEYLNAGKIFYCPSHKGNHPYRKYAPVWHSTEYELVGNYHYRGVGPRGVSRNGQPIVWTSILDQIEPNSSALIVDGIRTRADVNHAQGLNIFRADLSATWFSDPSGRLAESLPDSVDAANASQQVEDAWGMLDSAAGGSN